MDNVLRLAALTLQFVFFTPLGPNIHPSTPLTPWLVTQEYPLPCYDHHHHQTLHLLPRWQGSKLGTDNVELPLYIREW